MQLVSHRTFADMPSSVLNRRITVDVGQKSQTEPLGIVRRVGVSVNNDWRGRRMKNFTHTVV